MKVNRKTLMGPVVLAVGALTTGALGSSFPTSEKPPGNPIEGRLSSSKKTDEPIALSERDCESACSYCQKSCGDKPAGSERSDCQRNCTASAAGCCAGYGKKPPGFMGCYCN